MTTTRVRRRLSTAQRRAEIVAAALRIFAERDPSTVSMDELAHEADASPGLIYHYFGGKDGLAHAALDAAATRLIETMVVDTSAAAALQLDEGLRTYLAFLAAHPASWGALLRADAVGLEPGASVARTVDDHAIALSFNALAVQGTLPTLEQALRGWLDLVKGTCRRWLAEGRPEPQRLHQLLAGCFVGAVEAAASADPECLPAREALYAD